MALCDNDDAILLPLKNFHARVVWFMTKHGRCQMTITQSRLLISTPSRQEVNPLLQATCAESKILPRMLRLRAGTTFDILLIDEFTLLQRKFSNLVQPRFYEPEDRYCFTKSSSVRCLREFDENRNFLSSGISHDQFSMRYNKSIVPP